MLLADRSRTEPYQDAAARLEAYRAKYMGKHLKALLEELQAGNTDREVFVSAAPVAEPDTADDKAEVVAGPLVSYTPAYTIEPAAAQPPTPQPHVRTIPRLPVPGRRVITAVLVACGILFTLLASGQPDDEMFSRLLQAGPRRAVIAGIVRPASETTITVHAAVRIEDVLVEPGQAVTRGQALFVADDREARLALPAARLEREEARLQVAAQETAIGTLDRQMRQLSEQLASTSASLDVAARQVTAVPTPQVRESAARAQAALDLATLRLQRLQKLFGDGVVARREVDEADVAVRVARDDLEVAQRADAAYREAAAVEAGRAEARTRLAALEEEKRRLQASAELARARIRHEQAVAQVQALEARVLASRIEAPAGGTVAEVRVSRGDVVAPGAILARLADVARLVVEVHVPIGEVPRLRRGSAAEVTISAAAPIRETGTIRSIEPTAGPNGTHRVVVAFDAPPGTILSGQAATVLFP